MITRGLRGHSQQLRGAPAHSFRSGDEPFRPARIFGVKFGNSGCPLQEGHINPSHSAVVSAAS